MLNATNSGTAKAEIFYSGFMLGLVNILTSRYILDNERETGIGRSDITLIPKPDRLEPAVIIECKISKVTAELEAIAKVGLAQINDKRCDIKIKEVQKIMAFCGKEMAVEYHVDNNG